MKTVAIRDGRIVTEDRPEPTPGPGQVLVRSRACGVCGSDLHMLHHPEEMAKMAEAMGLTKPSEDGALPEIRLGHEYSAEVVSYGPATRGALAPGTRVCAVPFLLAPDAGPLGMIGVGLSNEVYGAMSEYFVLQEDFLLPTPEGLPDAGAALAEPLAVAIHFVARAEIAPDQAALVVGCGPIGLVTIEALKLRGVKTIIASDPVAGRRDKAAALGADQVFDPAADDAVAAAAARAEKSGKPLVIFECAGVISLFTELVKKAPVQTRIVFGGVHTGPATIHPGLAMLKELDLRFAFAYTPEEYAEALQALGDGRVDWRPLVTGKVGVDGVAEVFDVLSGPSEHLKIIVEPWRTGALEPFAAS